MPFACCMAKAWCQQGEWSLNDLKCVGIENGSKVLCK